MGLVEVTSPEVTRAYFWLQTKGKYSLIHSGCVNCDTVNHSDKLGRFSGQTSRHTSPLVPPSPVGSARPSNCYRLG